MLILGKNRIIGENRRLVWRLGLGSMYIFHDLTTFLSFGFELWIGILAAHD